MEIYLDNSATTKPYKEVIEKMVYALSTDYANPSSLHKKGIEVEKNIKDIRRNIARTLGAKDKEIYFTSGGTESNNAIIRGIVSLNKEPNKMKKSKFTTSKAKYVNAPIINELPLCLECKLVKILEEDLYLLEIVNVNADEKILDEKGNISLDKFIPISYDPSTHGYYKVQGRVGNAFSDGNKLK